MRLTSIGTILLLFLLFSVAAFAAGDPKGEWLSLKAQGKFDVLAERLEKDLLDTENPLPLRLTGAMELMEIYSLRMVDFTAAERAIGQADALNEALFGADYIENLRTIQACRRFLDYQKGELVPDVESRILEGLDGVFVFPAQNKDTARERLAGIEKLLRSEDEDSNARGVYLAAALIAATEAGDSDRGLRYWKDLQGAVADAEADLAARAEEAQRAKRKAVIKGIWQGVGAVYATAATAFVTYVTFGLTEDMGEGLKWTRDMFSGLGNTVADYQRTKRLSVESDFASGLNLFLGYPNQVRVLAAIGLIHQERGAPERAIPFLRQGIDISEMLRSTLRSEKERIAFQSVRDDLYDRMITVLMEKGEAEKALGYAERSRSRAFLDALAGGRIELRPDQGREAYAAIQETKSELSVMLDNAKMSDSQVELTERKIRGIHLKSEGSAPARDNLIQITSVVEPELAAVHRILASDQAILSYYCGESGVFGWVVRREDIYGMRLDLTPGELRARIRTMIDDIWQRKEGTEAAFLYQRLIAPFESRIAGRNLLVIPHDALHALPFGALHDGRGYLVQKQALAYSPSISVWQLLKKRFGTKRHGNRALIVAKPETEQNWPFLPFAEQEMNAVARLFGERATVLSGRRADKDRVMRLAESHDVLHLICHGYFDAGRPLESGLVLSGGEDGILRAREIFSMKLDGTLVVLSACETARSQILGGDEMVGLLRSFFFAGADDVVASLWMVDDQSTARLMSSFHRHLKKHGASEAIRLAQIDLMQDPRFEAPYYWAAFGLYGTE